MSFKYADDLCPSGWGFLAPLFFFGADGEMIAAEWKPGIFPRKTRSRPRYSVTTRGASMARQESGRRRGSLVPARCKLGSPVLDSPGVRLELVELLCFCAPRSHQKKCVLRCGVRTRVESAWQKETRPHGRSAQGFPKHFNVTDIQTDAANKAGGSWGGGRGEREEMTGKRCPCGKRFIGGEGATFLTTPAPLVLNCSEVK